MVGALRIQCVSHEVIACPYAQPLSQAPLFSILSLPNSLLRHASGGAILFH